MDLRTVLYDFDLTLADSSQGVIECVNYALGRMGLQAASSECIKQTIGLTLPATYKYLTGNTDQDQAAFFHDHFMTRADQVMAQFTHMFPSVFDVIRVLWSHGLMQGIVSTKRRYRIEEVTTRDGIRDYFSVIVGAEDVCAHKPDPFSLYLAMKRLGCGPQETVYVGDHWVDAEAAQRAGTLFIAVLTGQTKRDDFGRYPVHAFISDLVELPELLGIQTQEGRQWA